MYTGVSKGIILEQNKEPMLSRAIKRLSGCDEARQLLEQPVAQTPELLAPYEIVLIAREARIVDESDGRRLWKKLTLAMREGLNGLVADAIDDEPYISSQIGPALQFSEELSEGIALAKRAVGASDASIEIYKNLLDIDSKIPKKLGGVTVERVSGRYPAEYRSRRMLRRDNTLVIGAGALIALQRAVYRGWVQTSCFLTVAGDCVSSPGNYEVPVGITIAELLERVGLVTDPKRLVAGGSMTGFGITAPEDTLVTPTTRAVLAFADEFRDYGYSCIGCGRCARVCPEGLSPYGIYQVVKHRRWSKLALYDADLCAGCGTCSYVCPAKLDLAQSVLRAAAMTRGKEERL